MMPFNKLTKTEDQNFKTNSKIKFGEGSRSTYDENDLNQCFQFSWNMTFGALGEHRDHRSGGQHARSNAERFSDVFTGKLLSIIYFKIARRSAIFQL